jgi:hypothetical protein
VLTRRPAAILAPVVKESEAFGQQGLWVTQI